MKNHWIAIILMLVIPFLGISAEDTGKKEKKWYEIVSVSGFVDVYYQYNLNNIDGNKVDNSRAFERYNKQFQINAVELDLEKLATKDSNWGFRLDFQNGTNNVFQEQPYKSTSQIFNMNLLQQAYVSFYLPYHKGIVVDAGKMSTHIGWEVLESKDNINYTIGQIFNNTIPFIHTGARANITLTDRWNLTMFLYSSAGGTKFYAGNAANITNDKIFAYADNDSKNPAYGSQLKGYLVKDKVQMIWNTVYGNDNVVGRPANSAVMTSELINSQTGVAIDPLKPQSSYKDDHWFINNLIFVLTPSDKMTVVLDWTFGEKSGTSNPYNQDGKKLSDIATAVGTTLPTGIPDVTVNRSGSNAKAIYNTYGVWVKYSITDKFLMGFRYENLDDSRYGGAFVSTPNGANATRYRYDLNNNPVAITNYGQVRTLTFTPTYNWSDNLQLKLDLRRDWALGEQFIGLDGKPSHYQLGAILGMVAKF